MASRGPSTTLTHYLIARADVRAGGIRSPPSRATCDGLLIGFLPCLDAALHDSRDHRYDGPLSLQQAQTVQGTVVRRLRVDAEVFPPVQDIRTRYATACSTDAALAVTHGEPLENQPVPPNVTHDAPRTHHEPQLQLVKVHWPNQ
jgi:hypothetical protein